jgi:hypothetical protein
MAVVSSRSQVIKKLNAKKGKIKEVASEVLTKSFLSDEEICELLELDEEAKTIVVAKVTRCQDGNDKNGVPYIILNFVITEGEHRGVALSKYITIDLADEKRLLRELKTLYMMLQNLGEDTTEWDNACEEMYEACDRLSDSKPACRMALTKYVSESDPPRTYLNMNIIGLMDASTDDEEETEESEEEQEEEDVKPKAAKGKTRKVAEPEEEPEEEESEDEESEESENDDTDWSEWVGYKCSFESDGETIEGESTSYDADTNLFTVSDAAGDQYEVYPDDLTW